MHRTGRDSSGSSPNSFDVAGAYNGLFIEASKTGRRSTGFRDVGDGLSNSVAFSERVKGIGTNANAYDNTKPSSTTVSISVPAAENTPDPAYTLCKATAPSASGTLWSGRAAGRAWHIGYPTTARFVHVMPPNTRSCGYVGEGGSMRGVFGASSRHSGLVNVGMVDGSVRSVKNSIAVATWWALGTINNNEVIDSSSL